MQLTPAAQSAWRMRTVGSIALSAAMMLSAAMVLSGCGSGGAVPGAAGGGPTPQVSVAVSGAPGTRLNASTQFTATVSNSSSQAVTWQVSGITGGSAATGTISPTGLYTAPATLPVPNTVTIAAVSQAASGVSGSFTEAVWNPLPVMTAEAATQVGQSGSVLLDVRGTSFVPGAQIQVGGTSVATSFISPTELQATLTPAAGTTTFVVVVTNPDPGAASSASVTVQLTLVQTPLASAARLLDQATFGPTLTDIQHVQSVGLEGYLAEQFALPATTLPDLPNPLPVPCAPSNPIPCEQGEWWQAAVTAPDQLRQRVALALAEMFVVSTNSVNPASVITYQNLLTRDAFGNFSTVMRDVTLSAAMGNYLNMLNSYKPGNGQIANENFAREMMQLFTIGLNELDQNGNPRLDSSGNMIPTYTQTQVQAFARAYTGWTYGSGSLAAGTCGAPAKFPNSSANFDCPMGALDSAHDTTAKTLLNGTTLPAGQTASADLQGALANLFAHPNVGPFVCRQLIQHLVASNPSPAYVGRVAAVFANNGSGVRGDLKAVVHAILMDQEARAGDTNPNAEGGHLREPILYVANMVRGLGFTNTDANGFWGSLSNYSGALGEKPYGSGSVFNFFPPNYVIPGTTVNAPEFDIENTASAILRLTQADQVVYNRLSGFTVDLSASSALGKMASKTGNAQTDCGNLVDALGSLFMHGQMPANMRSAIVSHVATLTDPAQRVRVATYLVITSSQYKILH